MRLVDRIAHRIDSVLPAAVGVRRDLLSPLHGDNGPMNGQSFRQQLVRDLMQNITFEEIIETGTYRGTTTTFLSDVSGLPVYSAEAMLRHYRYARIRCTGYSSITLYHGDSRDLLRKLARRPGNPTLFFYLDAHWSADVPRCEELEIINSRWKRSVVMIDDFQIPDDPGYGYTEYHGAPLNLEYLPPLPGWRFFYPATESTQETGCKRGCLILASPDIAEELTAQDGLRPAGLPALSS